MVVMVVGGISKLEVVDVDVVAGTGGAEYKECWSESVVQSSPRRLCGVVSKTE